MLSSQCGTINLRKAIIDVIFITDGRSNGPYNVCDKTKCFEHENFRNINVFAFGIGNKIDYNELKCIVGNRGDKDSIFNFDDFTKFEQFKNQAVSGAPQCKAL